MTREEKLKELRDSYAESLTVGGYKCEIKMVNGHLCGYLTVPSDHPWTPLSDLEIHRRYQPRVHGGPTYAWRGVVGFDCNHWGDAPHPVYASSLRLPASDASWTFKDRDFVVENLLRLAEAADKAKEEQELRGRSGDFEMICQRMNRQIIDVNLGLTFGDTEERVALSRLRTILKEALEELDIVETNGAKSLEPEMTAEANVRDEREHPIIREYRVTGVLYGDVVVDTTTFAQSGDHALNDMIMAYARYDGFPVKWAVTPLD